MVDYILFVFRYVVLFLSLFDVDIMWSFSFLREEDQNLAMDARVSGSNTKT